jgi:preprotein translocase subunit YajC
MMVLINIASVVIIVFIILHEVKQAKKRKAEKAALKANERVSPQSERNPSK